jgi:hypothetical protein
VPLPKAAPAPAEEEEFNATMNRGPIARDVRACAARSPALTGSPDWAPRRARRHGSAQPLPQCRGLTLPQVNIRAGSEWAVLTHYSLDLHKKDKDERKV